MHVSQLHCHCATVIDEKSFDFVQPNKQIFKKLNKKNAQNCDKCHSFGFGVGFCTEMALQPYKMLNILLIECFENYAKELMLNAFEKIILI